MYEVRLEGKIMAIHTTAAAQAIEKNPNEVDSYQLISLLMAGGLERIQQAKQSLSEGNEQDAEVLIEKLLGIINGLRSSLNFEQGGEIAVNLDNLYDYMINRIDASAEEEKLAAMSEVGDLLSEVKGGWDEMTVEAVEVAEK